MNTLLILLVLKAGAIKPIYLGSYETPKACAVEAAKQVKTAKIDGDYALYVCVPTNEV